MNWHANHEFLSQARKIERDTLPCLSKTKAIIHEQRQEKLGRWLEARVAADMEMQELEAECWEAAV